MAESGIRKFFDLTAARWKSGEGGEILHHGVVSAATGAGLAYLEQKRATGLDVAIKGRHVPLDLTLAAAGTLLSLGMGGGERGRARKIIREASMTAFGIGAFRATEQYLHHKAGTMPYAHAKLVASAAHHGELPENADADMGADPILAAAAKL